MCSVSQAEKRMLRGSSGLRPSCGVVGPRGNADLQLVQLDAVVCGIGTAQDHAGQIDELFIVKAFTLCCISGGRGADLRSGAALVVDACGGRARWLRWPRAGGSDSLQNRRTHTPERLKMHASSPIDPVIGQPVVEHLLGQQVGGEQLCSTGRNPRRGHAQQRVQMGGLRRILLLQGAGTSAGTVSVKVSYRQQASGSPLFVTAAYSVSRNSGWYKSSASQNANHLAPSARPRAHPPCGPRRHRC